MRGSTGRNKLHACDVGADGYRIQTYNSRNSLTAGGTNHARRWHGGCDLAVDLVDLVQVPEPECGRAKTYEQTDNCGDCHRHSPSAWSQLQPPRDRPMELSGQRAPTLDAD